MSMWLFFSPPIFPLINSFGQILPVRRTDPPQRLELWSSPLEWSTFRSLYFYHLSTMEFVVDPLNEDADQILQSGVVVGPGLNHGPLLIFLKQIFLRGNLRWLGHPWGSLSLSIVTNHDHQDSPIARWLELTWRVDGVFALNLYLLDLLSDNC